MRFDARIDIGEGADRARNRAGGDILARRDQSLAVAREFGVSLGQFQSEGDRLGMDGSRISSVIQRPPGSVV